MCLPLWDLRSSGWTIFHTYPTLAFFRVIKYHTGLCTLSSVSTAHLLAYSEFEPYLQITQRCILCCFVTQRQLREISKDSTETNGSELQWLSPHRRPNKTGAWYKLYFSKQCLCRIKFCCFQWREGLDYRYERTLSEGKTFSKKK